MAFSIASITNTMGSSNDGGAGNYASDLEVIQTEVGSSSGALPHPLIHTNMRPSRAWDSSPLMAKQKSN